MRSALLVLGTIVLLPYIVLALGFILIGQAIASGSLAAFFMTLLSRALWLAPWRFIGIAGVIVLLAALGISACLRWLAAMCLGATATVCLDVILVGNTTRIGPPQLLFVLPCVAVLVFAAMVAVDEFRSLRLRVDKLRPDARSPT